MAKNVYVCIIFSFFLILYAVTCNNQGQSERMERLNAQLNAKAEEVDGGFGIAFIDFDSKATFFYNANEMMHAASLMKVPVMIEVYTQAANGIFSLSDSITVKNEFRSIVDGSPYSMNLADDSDDVIYSRIGKKMTIYDLVFEMITVSSNLATNILIDLVGAENVTATMRDIGAENILVLRGVEDEKAFALDRNNVTNAADMLILLEAIARNQIVSAAACEQMRDILLAQKFNTKIPALLPKSFTVAHKTGSITRIDHDAGILFTPDGGICVLVVLTKGIEDHALAARTIAEITLILLKEFNYLDD